MKILLITTLVALANADVSHLVNTQGFSGYNYEPAPQTSYGVPQASVVGNGASLTLPSSSGSLEFNTGYNAASTASSNSAPSVNFVHYSQPSSNNGYQFSSQYSQSSGSGLNGIAQIESDAALNSASQGSSGFGIGGASGTNYAGVNGAYNFGQTSGASFNFGASAGQGSSGAASDANHHGQINGESNFGGQSSASFNFGSAGSTYQGKTTGGSIDESFGVATDAASGASASAAADVSKHLYFFSAPEEEDEVVQAKYDLPAVPAKKTYKIIFIKAPTYKNQATITLPSPPQNEEKTLVYVLVKKPETQPKVQFKDAAPTQPSKPEVFFIKYKTQKEAEAAVAEIQSKHGASGQVIANLPAGTQAAFQSPDGSIVHNPSSVDIGSVNGLENKASSTSSAGGFSLDSLGANSFVGANVANRISEQVVSVQPQTGGDGLQTPVGQKSVDSLQLFGGGNVASQSAGASSSAEVSGTQQENETSTDEEPTTTENVSDCCSRNVEQRVGGVSGSDGQTSNEAGFTVYGPPLKYKRFSSKKY